MDVVCLPKTRRQCLEKRLAWALTQKQQPWLGHQAELGQTPVNAVRARVANTVPIASEVCCYGYVLRSAETACEMADVPSMMIIRRV